MKDFYQLQSNIFPYSLIHQKRFSVPTCLTPITSLLFIWIVKTRNKVECYVVPTSQWNLSYYFTRCHKNTKKSFNDPLEDFNDIHLDVCADPIRLSKRNFFIAPFYWSQYPGRLIVICNSIDCNQIKKLLKIWNRKKVYFGNLRKHKIKI